MSANDDDDFWENEDFIATIENVVKKAEEASAARHGGTQFGGATPRSSTIIPPQTVNSRIAEASPSIHGTPQFHESHSFRLSNGSTALARREAYSGTAFCHEEHAKLEHRGTPSFGPPHQLGQQRVPPQSANYHGASLLAGVPKDGYSPRQSSQGVQSPGRAGDVGEENRRVQELMAEKDGAISVLRSRVQQAEQQIDDLRKKVGPQSASHASLYQQQRELERLSAQLLFKEHEVTEAQRARAEKEERLKDALAETVALKEELERLKKARQTGFEFKQPREGDMDIVEKNAESCIGAPPLPHVSVRNTTGLARQNHDPWSPPWRPERSLEGVQDMMTAGLHGKILKDAPEVGSCPRLQDQSPAIETLKLRTGGNGCVASDVKESLKGDKGQENELLRRDMPRIVGTSMSVRSDAEGSHASPGLNNFSRTSEMYYSLQQLWGLKGVTNDGISLLSKLYASCRQDLYILLSSGDSQGVPSLKSPHKGKERQTESGTIAEKLHMALAKIANGFAHPEIIITPLLEFCKLDDVNLIGSALHILRCSVHHDSSCRRQLLLRGSQGDPEHQVPLLASYETLEKLEKSGEGKGWFIRSGPKGSSINQMGPVVVFSSPRIRCHPQVGDNCVQHVSGLRDRLETGIDVRGHQRPRPSDKQHEPDQKNKETQSRDTSVPVEDLNLPVKWLLHLALTTSSPNVKFEAVAILGVLVVNSEPLIERAMFGPLLCHGGIELFLKESAGAEMQLQAAKSVTEKDTEMAKQTEMLPVVDGFIHEIPSGQDLEKSETIVAPQQASYSALSKVKLLEGMTECLKNSGNSLQGHALHRSVIRLLTFIATSGDSGAAFLLQGASHKEQMCKDDLKLDGIVGGESASGQQIVGDGSGSHLKGLDLGDKGIGIPIGLVNERVDDLDRVQNIPQRLVSLINLELDIDEREGWNEPSIADERDRLIREAMTLLCCLSSHTGQSSVMLGHLISNKDMARLTLSVTNRLVTRKSRSQQSGIGQRLAAPRNSDIVELARGLRRQVLSSLAESGRSL